MEKKIFWTLFIGLGLIADFTLPLLWGVLATLPIVVVSWWIAYRKGGAFDPESSQKPHKSYLMNI